MWYNVTVLMHLEYARELHAICCSKTCSYTAWCKITMKGLPLGFVAKAWLMVLLSPASDFHSLVPPKKDF